MPHKEIHHWIRGVWKESDERRLLVLKQLPSSFDTISLAESMDTNICYVPEGCTGIAQPMDVSNNAPFKKAFQEQRIQCRRTPAARKPDGRIMIQLVINWLSQEWESISTETITKSCLVCRISNAVDGSKDHFIQEEIPRDLEDGNDEVDQEGGGEDDDVDNLDPYSDSD